MLPLFQDNFILGEATSSHFFQSNYIDRTVTFFGQLFLHIQLHISSFSEATISQELFFQKSFFFWSETSTEQALLEN